MAQGQRVQFCSKHPHPIRRLTAYCHTNIRGFNTLFQTLWIPTRSHTETTPTDAHIEIKRKLYRPFSD